MTRSPGQDQPDLIVVGGSIGGLAAAIIAADRRCRALILERGKELGGSAGAEAETIAAAGSRLQQEAGIADSPAQLVDDILASARHHVEPALVSALAEQGAPLVAWLASRCGSAVELLRGPRTGHCAARLHVPGPRGGASLVADLTRAAIRHSHITVRTGAVVERLVRDEAGAVQGIAIRGDRRGASHTFSGRVLLASGGFVANDELVATHCPDAAVLPYCGAALATGDGLQLAREAGAGVHRMSACLVTPFLAMPGQLAIGTPLVELGAMLVNQAGRRFADETGEGLGLAITVRAQPGKVAYLLFDERIADAARAADPFFRQVILPRAGRRGSTIPDLSKQLELDAEGLALTIDTFNGNLDLGGDPFGRDRFGGRLEAPFHAIRVTGARLRTLGGLAVDASARVLDGENRPIPGLYAAGGTAAGLGGDGTEGILDGTAAPAALGLGSLAALDVIAAAAAARAGEE